MKSKGIVLTVAGIFILLFSNARAFAAIKITATGGWNRTIAAADLSAGAGSDLNSTYSSANNATSIDISSAGVSSWRVFVSRADTLWDPSFSIYVQRTSNGTGAGTISGGMAYQLVTTTDALFFSGSRNRTGVTVQYQLQGVSLNNASNAYNTVVTFTVTSP